MDSGSGAHPVAVDWNNDIVDDYPWCFAELWHAAPPNGQASGNVCRGGLNDGRGVLVAQL